MAFPDVMVDVIIAVGDVAVTVVVVVVADAAVVVTEVSDEMIGETTELSLNTPDGNGEKASCGRTRWWEERCDDVGVCIMPRGDNGDDVDTVVVNGVMMEYGVEPGVCSLP